jgi:hypothetical protein
MAKTAKVETIPSGRKDQARFGRVAIEFEFITQKQLDEALAIQGRSSPKPFLGAVLIELGYLTQRQLSRVLAAQASGVGFMTG